MRRLTIIVFAVLFSGITNLTGQEKEIVLSSNSIASLANGVHSENTGLKKSSIKMIARYKLKQVCPILIKQFESETSIDYKMLIAEVIYDVSCPEMVDSFRTVLKYETLEELKYFCDLLHENYLFANN
ncbi:MAG: hypothetical protein GXO85_08325 [Chlorobi bacterium]|nr:hypothetical protein [Chlorobiota bacterium]